MKDADVELCQTAEVQLQANKELDPKARAASPTARAASPIDMSKAADAARDWLGRASRKQLLRLWELGSVAPPSKKAMPSCPPLLATSVAMARMHCAAIKWFRNGLFIAPSMVSPNALGLFTMLEIDPNVRLGEYGGARMTLAQFSKLHPDKHRYAMGYTDKRGVERVIDPTDECGRLIDHADHQMGFINEPPPGCTANCYTEGVETLRQLRVDVVTSVRVPAFSELYMLYGRNYPRDYMIGSASAAGVDRHLGLVAQASTETAGLAARSASR